MTIPGPGRPFDVAQIYAEERSAAGEPMKRWRGEWYAHRDNHWQVLEADDVRTQVVRWLADSRVLVVADDGSRSTAPWPVKDRSVSDVMAMLNAVCHRPSEAGYTEGLFLQDCYLNAEMIPVDYSTRVWNMSAAAYRWDVKATCPVTLDWLNTILSPADVAMFRQWLGYLVSGRIDLQKMLLMLGPTRSGKGTLIWLMENLLGPGSTASVATFGELTKTFGLQPLIGKRLCVMPDVRWATKDAADAVPELLSIVGADPRDVARKNLTSWHGRLSARIVIGSNDAPSLPDASGALAARMLTITMSKSYLGREDPHLKDKLRPELPGLLRWALGGLEEINKEGRFRESVTSEEAREVTRLAGNPTYVFVEDACTLGPHAAVQLEQLYEVYVWWCKRNGYSPLASHVLSRQLSNTFRGQVKSQRIRHPVSGARQRWIRGLTLNVDPHYSDAPVPSLFDGEPADPDAAVPDDVPDGVPDE